MSELTYPVRVEGHVDQPLSRWLWLVKWLLVIPHYFVLVFLWLTVFVLSIGAFFAILFTRRYPRSIFEFNVGVMRWTWRVGFYAYSALGTDRYPPFTLQDVPDYPARLDVAYPGELSQGLVLVKWWLLVIPHYLLLAVFFGGSQLLNTGLAGLLVLFIAVALLFTGRYPQDMFDLVMGLNRWGWRVSAYVLLMTDQYPPFRLDQGGADLRGMPPPPVPGVGPAAALGVEPAAAPAPLEPSTQPSTQPPTQPPTGPSGETQSATQPSRWTAGRVVAVVLGSAMVVGSLVMFTASAATIWLDQTQRDGAGYLTSPDRSISTDTRAITTDKIQLGTGDVDWPAVESGLGDVRIRVTADNDAPVFAGIARTEDADAYLRGVARAVTGDITDETVDLATYQGDAPRLLPAKADIWVASASGAGEQTVRWEAESGDYTVVVMNPDGSPNVDVRADVAATLPALDWVIVITLVGGGVQLLVGLALILLGWPRGQRATVYPTGTPTQPPVTTSTG